MYKDEHFEIELPTIEDMGDLKPDFDRLVEDLHKTCGIDQNLYLEYDVKRGLRDASGKGVLTGLTEISDVVAYDMVGGHNIPADGRLYYQGVNVVDIIDGMKGRRFGFEETSFLLLFGHLPNTEELDSYLRISESLQDLSNRFIRDVVMKASNGNIMNALQRCVLTLYTYDADPDGISPENVLRQSLELINKLPLIAVYSYNSYCHFRRDESLVIRNPRTGHSLAENILYMLRPDGIYTDLEARVLDTALILHAEHGGGNNSSFTTHVVTSSGTDTYSSTAASIGSLKGPRHGGANIKVQNMFAAIRENVSDWDDKDQIKSYLSDILDKKVFDKAGLIYGMGHAVYTLSDPREVILKKYAKGLAEEKGLEAEFRLYENVESVAGQMIMERRHLEKNVCANVDFYSGFVYSMLGIPEELFTPIFAIARMPGWCSHRLEELMNASKIIRPAYKYVGHHVDYTPIDKR
ncbi:MAG: citrate/2-methylcitrate synthase [Lachnospiraceae bacterium]|nr:citrate/2-methylcitrate synthase [Lachnospiraceae bacterium]